MFNQQTLKKDFPIFNSNPTLVYLDSAATALKPKQIIQKENEYYQKYSANIYRGIYQISEQATIEYEIVRDKVAEFIRSKNSQEIVFTRNTTEAINLIMYSWGRKNIDDKSEVVTTMMEHHANFVPWQILCQHKRSTLHIVNITKDGYLDEHDLLNKVNHKTKLVVFTHISNVLGTINPVKKLVKAIKQKNPQCLVLVDGAQAVPHLKVNVIDLGCDFYVFSSHKMLGPTGVGILWGKYKLLENMQPYQYGGEMIQAVYHDHTEFKSPPHKFEAGTPHIAGVIGLGAAIDYIKNLGIDNIRQHEVKITEYALKEFKQIKDLEIYGPQKAQDRGGVITFTMGKMHPHDIAQILDSSNICIRSGHHCAMPLHIQLGISSTARAWFYLYTTKKDIDKLIKALINVRKILN